MLCDYIINITNKPCNIYVICLLNVLCNPRQDDLGKYLKWFYKLLSGLYIVKSYFVFPLRVFFSIMLVGKVSTFLKNGFIHFLFYPNLTHNN